MSPGSCCSSCVGRIRDRLAAFPDLTTSVEDMFVSGDKLAITLIWRGTHTGSYGGIAGTGKSVEVRDSAIWHFKNGKVTEIFTLQDQFGLLKQIGRGRDLQDQRHTG